MKETIFLCDKGQGWEYDETLSYNAVITEDGLVPQIPDADVIMYMNPINLDKYKKINTFELTFQMRGNAALSYGVSEHEDQIPTSFEMITMKTSPSKQQFSHSFTPSELKGNYLWIMIQLWGMDALMDYFRFEFDLDLPEVPPYEKERPEIEKILRGHRIERYRAILLDRKENEKGMDLKLLGGSIDINYFREIYGTATLEIEDSNIDYVSDRVRLVYEVLLPNGEWHTFNLGTFLFNLPNRIKEGEMIRVHVDCFDKLIILQQDFFDQSYVVPAGSNIVEKVEEIIASTGEIKINIEPSAETLISDKVWQLGTDKLTIVNDLLQMINYLPLWVDEYGYYRSIKYQAPEKRTVIWEFTDDKESLYLPDMMLEGNMLNIPNKIILITNQLEEEPLIVIKTLEDIGKANSIYSYTKRGRWIVRMEVVEASSLEILDSMAERMLIEGLQLIERIVYTHAWIPGIYPHGAVIFKNNKLNLNERYTLHAQKITLKAGNLVTSTIRRIIT